MSLPKDLLYLIFLELDHGYDMLNFSELNQRCHQIFKQQIVVRESHGISIFSKNIIKCMYNNQDQKHGIWIIWYLDGQLYSQHNYFQDQLHGPRREWYPDGELRYESNYHHGQKHGLQQGWYLDGQFSYRLTYKHGTWHGLQRDWHSNGQVKSEQMYYNGQLCGITRRWSKNGSLEYKCNHLEN